MTMVLTVLPGPSHLVPLCFLFFGRCSFLFPVNLAMFFYLTFLLRFDLLLCWCASITSFLFIFWYVVMIYYLFLFLLPRIKFIRLTALHFPSLPKKSPSCYARWCVPLPDPTSVPAVAFLHDLSPSRLTCLCDPPMSPMFGPLLFNVSAYLGHAFSFFPSVRSSIWFFFAFCFPRPLLIRFGSLFLVFSVCTDQIICCLFLFLLSQIWFIRIRTILLLFVPA
jgi:hypothetical protein